MQRQLISSRTATLVVSEVASNGDYKLNRQQWWQVKPQALAAHLIEVPSVRSEVLYMDFESYKNVHSGVLTFVFTNLFRSGRDPSKEHAMCDNQE